MPFRLLTAPVAVAVLTFTAMTLGGSVTAPAPTPTTATAAPSPEQHTDDCDPHAAAADACSADSGTSPAVHASAAANTVDAANYPGIRCHTGEVGIESLAVAAPGQQAATADALRQAWVGADTEVWKQSGGTRQLRLITERVGGECRPKVSFPVAEADYDLSQRMLIKPFKNAGFNRLDRLYMVAIPRHQLSACGFGQLQRNNNMKSPLNSHNVGNRYATVRCVTAKTVLHETMHLFGAVNSNAPNASPAGHCVETYDLMCYHDHEDTVLVSACPVRDLMRLDCGRDDYWNINPGPGNYLSKNWNTADSAYLYGGGPAHPNLNETRRPDSITGITVTSSSATTVSFSWNKATAADGYNLRLRDSSHTIIRAEDTASTSHTFTGLTPGFQGVIQVTAKNINGYAFVISQPFQLPTKPTERDKVPTLPDPAAPELRNQRLHLTADDADGYQWQEKGAGNNPHRTFDWAAEPSHAPSSLETSVCVRARYWRNSAHPYATYGALISKWSPWTCTPEPAPQAQLNTVPAVTWGATRAWKSAQKAHSYRFQTSRLNAANKHVSKTTTGWERQRKTKRPLQRGHTTCVRVKTRVRDTNGRWEKTRWSPWSCTTRASTWRTATFAGAKAHKNLVHRKATAVLPRTQLGATVQVRINALKTNTSVHVKVGGQKRTFTVKRGKVTLTMKAPVAGKVKVNANKRVKLRGWVLVR